MKKTIFAIIIILVILGGVGYFIFNNYFQYESVGVNIPIKKNPTDATSLELISKQISLQNGKIFYLQIPLGYNISPAAEGLGRARFMAKSPDGRLFVTDMKDLTDNSEGKIYILEQVNQNTKRFAKKTIYLDNLRNPNSLAFYTDRNGTEWLYIALTDRLIRYKYSRGENSPTSVAETLATYPDYGLSYKYGGWHLTRTVVAKNHKIYVSVGSSCNTCEEKEEIRATISEMDPDGSNQKIIAYGLRNAVGMTFKENSLYASAMGSDHLGDDKPEETLYKIIPGSNYGWPYCYEYQSKIYEDKSKDWQEPINCSGIPFSIASFPAHSAPLGVEYFDKKSEQRLQDSFLIALHGSSDVKRKKGYSVVRADSAGNVVDFITGFLSETTRYGRPAGILKESSSSFFFTDDFNGILYYVYKQ